MLVRTFVPDSSYANINVGLHYFAFLTEKRESLISEVLTILYLHYKLQIIVDSIEKSRNCEKNVVAGSLPNDR